MRSTLVVLLLNVYNKHIVMIGYKWFAPYLMREPSIFFQPGPPMIYQPPHSHYLH